MLYQAYQAHSDIMVPVRAWAGMAIRAIAPVNGFSGPALKNLTAAYELNKNRSSPGSAGEAAKV